MKKEIIIEEKTFLEMVKQNNLTPIEVAPNTELSVQLTCDENTFLHIASSKSAEVYYAYKYPEDHEILITGKTLEEASRVLREQLNLLGISVDFSWYIDMDIYPDSYPSDDDEEIDYDKEFTQFERQLKKEILDYNQSINIRDISEPRQFVAFYIDCGCLVGIMKKNPKPDNSIAEEKLKSLISVHKETIEKQMEAAESKKKEVKEKLKDFLINDAQFRLSSNQRLRGDYAYNLWNNKDYKWIHSGFDDTREFSVFIERIYRELKYYGSKK